MPYQQNVGRIMRVQKLDFNVRTKITISIKNDMVSIKLINIIDQKKKLINIDSPGILQWRG